MKKILAGLISALAIVAMCVCLGACSNSEVAGNTYVFSDIEVVYPEGTTDEMKEAMEAGLVTMKAAMKDSTVTFGKDGTATISGAGQSESGYYKQDGNKIYLLEEKDEEVTESTEYLTVDGNRLVQSGEEGGLTMRIVFVKK